MSFNDTMTPLERQSLTSMHADRYAPKRVMAKAYRAAAKLFESGKFPWRLHTRRAFAGGGCAVGGIDHVMALAGKPTRYGIDEDERICYRHFPTEAEVLDQATVSERNTPFVTISGLVLFNDNQPDDEVGKANVITALREIAYRLEHGGKPSPSHGGPKYYRKSRPDKSRAVNPVKPPESTGKSFSELYPYATFTEAQAIGWQELIDLVAGMPEENFNWATFQDTYACSPKCAPKYEPLVHNCGTMGCVAGWTPALSYAKQNGYGFKKDGDVYGPGGAVWEDGSEAFSRLFGLSGPPFDCIVYGVDYYPESGIMDFREEQDAAEMSGVKQEYVAERMRRFLRWKLTGVPQPVPKV